MAAKKSIGAARNCGTCAASRMRPINFTDDKGQTNMGEGLACTANPPQLVMQIFYQPDGKLVSRVNTHTPLVDAKEERYCWREK